MKKIIGLGCFMLQFLKVESLFMQCPCMVLRLENGLQVDGSLDLWISIFVIRMMLKRANNVTGR